MFKLRFVLFSFFMSFSFSILADSTDVTGTYEGNKWGMFFWGEGCSVEVSHKKTFNSSNTENNHNYTITINNKKISENLFKGSVSKDGFDFLVELSKVNKQSHRFEYGSRMNEGVAKVGGRIYFEKGQLSQVYLWSAYLVFPSHGYTCGNLRKTD